MNEENILVITDREELYNKCENMEQLFDKYYLPLLDKHYSKTYKLQQENARLKDKIENATNFVDKYMDEWDFQDEVWQDMNDLLILLKEN